ncbi:hypothetical protein CTAYLR_008794 [Chrysophaeum taylorii]|uniref:Uncharacterized protein n=1 Tax=Chrysophaeum taylorii TaxID=2483200 RepID=A0AAD7XNG1_9STRA|nr:hypothetical protein CTAYLR_008794 [Chrysophaeum taylorii]
MAEAVISETRSGRWRYICNTPLGVHFSNTTTKPQMTIPAYGTRDVEEWKQVLREAGYVPGGSDFVGRDAGCCVLLVALPACWALAPGARLEVPRRALPAVFVPLPALAEGETESRDCNEAVYLVLRVQEAAQQETRLVKSGKFKDLQRANVKFAITLMLKNYGLLDAVTSASLLSSESFEASQAGKEAVEALQQILEYFDSSARSLNVETLSGDKLDFVVKALDAADRRISTFLSLLPDSEVERAKKVILLENKKNLEEYEMALPGESYLNPAPKTA